MSNKATRGQVVPRRTDGDRTYAAKLASRERRANRAERAIVHELDLTMLASELGAVAK